MVYPESHGCHGHGVTSHHPDLVGDHISFMDRAQSVQGGDKPPGCHEHEQGPFPETSLCEKGHIQSRGGAQEKDNEYIDLARDTMNGFRLFQDITRELDEGGADAQSTGGNMNIKATIVEIAAK